MLQSRISSDRRFGRVYLEVLDLAMMYGAISEKRYARVWRNTFATEATENNEKAKPIVDRYVYSDTESLDVGMVLLRQRAR